jgi:hypothetical protein
MGNIIPILRNIFYKNEDYISPEATFFFKNKLKIKWKTGYFQTKIPGKMQAQRSRKSGRF